MTRRDRVPMIAGGSGVFGGGEVSLMALVVGTRSAVVWRSTALAAALCLTSAVPAAADPFPAGRTVSRAAATACLTTRMQEQHGSADPAGVGARQALANETLRIADGLVLRYRPAETLDGPRPEWIDAIHRGVDEARAVMAGYLGLAVPTLVEVVLVDLEGDAAGYLVAADPRSRRAVIAVDSTARAAFDPREVVIHQYAHAVAALTGYVFPAGWGEAFAVWVTTVADGTLSAATAAAISHRLARLDAGLFNRGIEWAAGDAAWFGFLDEAYGPATVRRAVEELAGDPEPAAAMDRALRETTGDDLAAAFREFHLWAFLSGDRADGFHFSYASRLEAPGYASVADGLPALAVRSDPAVASWGATQIRIRPAGARGGARVHFEGEFPGRWQVDLLLVGKDGSRRRLPLAISAEGRGAATVPVDDVEEALLLVRNLATDDVPPRRYTYVVEADRDYPFTIVSLEATALRSGIAVSWETAVEQDLAGFNVLRGRADGGPEMAVNPVWIPALGDLANPTAYHYLDPTAKPGVDYVFRVQGITTHGLTRSSDPVVARRSPPR